MSVPIQRPQLLLPTKHPISFFNNYQANLNQFRNRMLLRTVLARSNTKLQRVSSRLEAKIKELGSKMSRRTKPATKRQLNPPSKDMIKRYGKSELKVRRIFYWSQKKCVSLLLIKFLLSRKNVTKGQWD